uniref:Uncharacterized protein n=1 Tax=Tanacetum cinerariifolium TaxID=118510 RepID=A0A6L2KUF4_TANCI|nr:hypothetical protein [Tanacetum cinerariifolium]
MQELYITFSTLEGKLWWIGRSWVFDLNKYDLCPSFVEGLAAKGLGPSCGGFPYWGGTDVPKALTKPMTHLENLKCSFFYIKNKVILSSFPELLLEDNKFNKKSFNDKIPLLPQMDPLSFMIQGVDGEFNYLLEGGPDENRSSTKSVNNEALVINVKPISIVHPLNIAKNIMDSHNISSDEGGLSPISPYAPSYLEKGKRSTILAQASKVAGDASSPFDVDSDLDIHEFPSTKELKDTTDYHWVVAQVTPPYWKPYLREISTETRELISALHKAMASSDTMQEKEIRKDKAYAELEKKCNEKILLFSICVLRLRPCRVRLYPPFMLKSKASDLNGRDLRLSKSSFYRSDEMSVLIAKLVKASIIYARCIIFEEVAELKKPFVLEEMPGYRPFSKDEYDRASNDLADASYPFLAELTADLYAFVEQLLSKKPQSLQSKRLSLRAS